MGLVTSKQNINNELVFLNLKHQDEAKQPIKPYFEVVRKNEEGLLKPSGEQPDTIEGRLKHIDSKAREFTRGGKKETGPEKATLYIADDASGETYALSLNYNIASRGLFNRVLNLDGGDNTRFSCWRDKEGWVVLSLKQNGENVKYKYAKEELPEVPKVKLGGKEIRDTAAVDAFFKEKLLEFSAELSGKKVEQGETKVESEEIPF
jgi:hypothetical protein